MVEYKRKCDRCGIIVTCDNPYPDERLNGPCPRDPTGRHMWRNA